jgi:hypothetical protein
VTIHSIVPHSLGIAGRFSLFTGGLADPAYLLLFLPAITTEHASGFIILSDPLNFSTTLSQTPLLPLPLRPTATFTTSTTSSDPQSRKDFHRSLFKMADTASPKSAVNLTLREQEVVVVALKNLKGGEILVCVPSASLLSTFSWSPLSLSPGYPIDFSYLVPTMDNG